MDEYINKKQLRKHLKECYKNELFDVDMKKVAIAIDLYVEDMKPVDVKPIRHGRWITKAKDYYKAWQDSGRSWDDMPCFITGKHIACSECFTEYDVCTEGIEHWIGCPCCLARMDGDVE